MNEQRKSSESGSVLLFGIGLGIIALIILTTAVNVASLWVTRTKLDSVADATALAASRSIDVDNFYLVGINQPIKLSESLARIRASDFLTKLASESELDNFKLVSLKVESDAVSLIVSAEADLPFGYLTYGFDTTVFSHAKVSIRTR